MVSTTTARTRRPRPDSDAALAALTAADIDHDGDDLGLRGGSERLGRWQELQPRRVRQLGRDAVQMTPTTTRTPRAAECPAPAVEPAAEDEAPVDTAPNAHGKAVSKVAQSDAVGGKNCNHGGAVSEAAKKVHDDQHGNAAKKVHDDQHGNAAKKAAGKAHGQGHGKGHDEP